MADEVSTTSIRSPHGSARRAPKNPQQQLSQIEKSVTHLLVATKQLLETLTLWSRGTATENEVSDVYVRLGYEFNIASRAFNAIGVDTTDLGNVPDLLRGILEETLSQEASQTSLDNFLPRIRDIIINLLHGLKKKQQRLRQRTPRDGATPNGSLPRLGSIGSAGELDDTSTTPSASTRTAPRVENSEFGPNGPHLPPRSASVATAGGRASPSQYDTYLRNHRATVASQASTDSSLSSTTAQQMPVLAPHPTEDLIPAILEPPASSPFIALPPPPPPPKQEDALAALQRGGELERRASRRFSAYQIQKHLGTNGIPLPPVQNSPIPNRGRDARESMNAVRTRASTMHNRTKSKQDRPVVDTTLDRSHRVSRRISEENGQAQLPSIAPPAEPNPEDSPTAKTPEDKLAAPRLPEQDQISLGATLVGPLSSPAGIPIDSPVATLPKPSTLPTRGLSRRLKSSSPQPAHFVPEHSPQPGKELTLFLQYKRQIKKYVFLDGGDLSAARLQLAFIEKFAWDTHRNGELPEIHIQDPVSGVRYELEDMNEVKDRAVLVLNVEQLDEVKSHIDDKFHGLSRLVESIKTVVEDQQSAIQRVAERQQQTAKEVASIAAAPTLSSARNSAMLPVRLMASASPSEGGVVSASALNEVQSLRRDLAIVRQTYSSFVSDIQASMSTIRTKASVVKSTAIKAALPTLDGGAGRAYINPGKKTLQDDSEKIVNRVDDLQDLVEDLRKDVVMRGVRPKPRQLESTAKELSAATHELKKLQEFLSKEKPLWTKIWEQELQTVCEERDLLTMQEELAADLQDDLEKASQTFELVEQATKQQNLEIEKEPGKLTPRSASGRNLHAAVFDKTMDPRQARDGLLGEVKALQPNHENRLEAIERAEKARQRELESRNEDEFKRELGNFVEEGKLKKSGGVEEAERLRKAKDERARKENFEREAARQQAKLEKAQREAEAMAAATTAAHGENANGNAQDEAAEPADEAKGDEDRSHLDGTIHPSLRDRILLLQPAAHPAPSPSATPWRQDTTSKRISSSGSTIITSPRRASSATQPVPRTVTPHANWLLRSSLSLSGRSKAGVASTGSLNRTPARPRGKTTPADGRGSRRASVEQRRDDQEDHAEETGVPSSAKASHVVGWLAKLLG